MSIQDVLPTSRLTLRYRTEISGEPEDIELPMRLLMVGDFSGGSNKNTPFQERSVLQFDGKNTDEILKKMKVKIAIKNEDVGDETVNIPIRSVDSFSPSNVCNSIKKMSDMIESKKMLNHLLSNINNSTKFKRAIESLVGNQASVDALKERLDSSYKEKTTLPELSVKES